MGASSLVSYNVKGRLTCKVRLYAGALSPITLSPNPFCIQMLHAYVYQAYLSCKLAGGVEVLQTDATLPRHDIQLTRLLSDLVLKGAAALNAQQALGVCKA